MSFDHFVWRVDITFDETKHFFIFYCFKQRCLNIIYVISILHTCAHICIQGYTCAHAVHTHLVILFQNSSHLSFNMRNLFSFFFPYTTIHLFDFITSRLQVMFLFQPFCPFGFVRSISIGKTRTTMNLYYEHKCVRE